MVPGVDNVTRTNSLIRKQKIAYPAQVEKFLIKRLRRASANRKLSGTVKFVCLAIIHDISISIQNNVYHALQIKSMTSLLRNALSVPNKIPSSTV